MIFERMISGNIFRKIRQLESISKTSIFSNTCKPLQLVRTSTSSSGLNRCLNSNVITNGSNGFLRKFPATTTVGLQQTRNAATPTGDHVKMWVLERIVAMALPIVMPAAFIMENAALDGLMSVLVVMHMHWGFEAMITDYARPIVVGPIIPKVLHISLILLSAVTLAGLLVLIHNGPGVARSIKDFWAIGKQKSSEPPQH
ncbi:PREDICTED: succinate dehydrogenase [ubiquinone] cytochrome b small subunit, mitochondrial [Dufourea novaeangliae]|uniref:Succinate dehydrogenase [ubiquinone] cytochrome b small subunit n=1 Tax=Dufourea novaeangliae TaxID=178035 RepID=A0A154P2G7_DUFNO|nr:PREDICTED: succinate dehydrogenase [ubiquinone] cytochrome b small subunit, mitochondrial [Dufourea novaeangliae]KZC05310.1 Putative succinate dehydrogenase [ubiquinone] cytochrome b small subunit, mitochondrial [Dufourea novaeangliae]